MAEPGDLRYFDSAILEVLDREGFYITKRIGTGSRGVTVAVAWNSAFQDLARARLLITWTPVLEVVQDPKDGKGSRIKGRFSFARNWDSSAEFSIEFHPVGAGNYIGARGRSLRRFRRILLQQGLHNRLVSDYLELPDPEPLAQESFRALYVEIAVLFPQILASEELSDQLEGLIRGRGLDTRLVHLSERSTQLTSSLRISAESCSQCGAVERITELNLIDVERMLSRKVDPHSASRVMEEAHRRSECTRVLLEGSLKASVARSSAGV